MKNNFGIEKLKFDSLGNTIQKIEPKFDSLNNTIQKIEPKFDSLANTIQKGESFSKIPDHERVNSGIFPEVTPNENKLLYITEDTFCSPKKRKILKKVSNLTKTKELTHLKKMHDNGSGKNLPLSDDCKFYTKKPLKKEEGELSHGITGITYGAMAKKIAYDALLFSIINSFVYVTLDATPRVTPVLKELSLNLSVALLDRFGDFGSMLEPLVLSGTNLLAPFIFAGVVLLETPYFFNFWLCVVIFLHAIRWFQTKN